MVSLKEIPYQLTWPIRHTVMWPDKSLDYVKLKDDEIRVHYGLYIDSELTSILSLFIDHTTKTAQFRKFATLDYHQGKGYGSMLLIHLMAQLESMKVERIWCNARMDKTPFYEKFGMVKTEQEFIKGGIEYVIMEKSI